MWKAKVLEIIANTDGPVTVSVFRHSYNIPRHVLDEHLPNLVQEGCIIKYSFKDYPDMNPADYLGIGRSRKGVKPDYFYTITDNGLRKYEFYKTKGVYDSDLTPLEWWEKQKERLREFEAKQYG